MKSFRPHLRWLIPLTIFVVALFLRTYKLPETYMFGADEEYQATYARTIADDFHLVWIGVSAANTGIYLGPYWTYLTALIFTLTGGSPLATGYFAALLGAITATLIYLLGRYLAGKRASSIASILYALSPLVVYFDQKYWNPSSLPLLSLLLVYSATKIRDNRNWLYAFVITVGLIFHTHLSLFPLALVMFIFHFHSIISSGIKSIVVAIILFLLTISPLIVFDYYHNYSNITAPLRWGEIRSGLDGNPSDNATRATQMLGRLWYLEPGLSSANEARPVCSMGSTTTPSSWLTILALLPLIIYALSISKWKDPTRRALILAYLSLLIPFIFYPGKNYEYYLLGSIPLYILMISTLLARLKRYILIPMIISFVIFSSFTLYSNNTLYGLRVKRELIQDTLSYVNGSEFTLQEFGDCHRYEGWRYLYTVYGRWPLRSSIDNTYGWLYPDEISDIGAEYTIQIYGTGQVPELEGEYFRRGGFTAIVLKL